MVLSVRPVDKILREVPKRGGRVSAAGLRAPADFIEHGLRLKTHKFAIDYRFFSQPEIRERCEGLDYPKAGLFAKHIPFGESGRGDLWCLRGRSDRSRVTFLDHDDEDSAKPYDIGISFDQWLQVADLAGQMDRAVDKEPELLDEYRRIANNELNKISRGLPKRLPMRI